MNEHENQTMKIFGKRLTASLLGAALVMSMPFASALTQKNICLLYTSPSPRDRSVSRMPSSA